MKLTKDNWCRYLRWKGYHRDVESPLHVINALAAGDVSFSCLHTAWPSGPDDQLACPEGCNMNRPCFQSHPKTQESVKALV